jgi:Tfp pilus assembly protein FimV
MHFYFQSQIPQDFCDLSKLHFQRIYADLDQVAEQLHTIAEHERFISEQWQRVAPFALRLRHDMEGFANGACKTFQHHQNLLLHAHAQLDEATHALHALAALPSQVQNLEQQAQQLAALQQQLQQQAAAAAAAQQQLLLQAQTMAQAQAQAASAAGCAEEARAAWLGLQGIISDLQKIDLKNISKHVSQAYAASSACTSTTEKMQTEIADLRQQIAELRNAAASVASNAQTDFIFDQRLTALEAEALAAQQHVNLLVVHVDSEFDRVEKNQKKFQRPAFRLPA